ncbi:MAG: 30S ribosomal protein S12 methylthiotransferase RimO [Candidatus Obscuribacterales bacterium]|nr:30S ribosomal protein S12 methylthiotransferase RimO [Candidatus Obscuribacterales bacterium]
MLRNPTFGVVSLGCPKNQTDTEVMLGLLKEAGFTLTFDNDDADICLINTCSFIEDARRESVRQIVELAEDGKELIIAGCMAQHFKDQLLEELPEARALVGTGDIHKIVEVAKAIVADSSLRIVQVSAVPDDHIDEVQPRLATGVGVSAYLKIAEGCDHACTFCIIPMLRGKFRSRSIDSIVKEARMLVASGTRELILISQDTTYYGLDNYGHMALPELLEALHEIEDLEWIRIMYFYPTETNRKLLETIARLPKIVKYIDIPLQHSHPEILKSMARPLSPEKSVALIREILPEAAVRSTFIVGFPGETEEHFEHLLAFIQEQKFDRLGVFAYSKEKEVPSGSMPDQVPQKVKKARRNKIMEAQQSISLARNERLVGQRIKVMIESFDEQKGWYYGRSQWDAPQIDNTVYIEAEGLDYNCLGEFVEVEITSCKPYDLYGKAVLSSVAGVTAEANLAPVR